MRSFSIVLAVSMILSVSAQSADTLTVVLTGDILLDRGVRQVINRHGVSHLFSDGIDSVFRQAQIVVGAISNVPPRRSRHPSSNNSSSEPNQNGSTPCANMASPI